jgi:hypothetical protein
MSELNDADRQFRQAVQGVFSSTLGQWLLNELTKNTVRPFNNDPYRTAYNCGAQDLVALLREITEER